jgi:hypothetical protein
MSGSMRAARREGKYAAHADVIITIAATIPYAAKSNESNRKAAQGRQVRNLPNRRVLATGTLTDLPEILILLVLRMV